MELLCTEEPLGCKTKAIVRAASHDLCNGCCHCAKWVIFVKHMDKFDFVLIGHVHLIIFSNILRAFGLESQMYFFGWECPG